MHRSSHRDSAGPARRRWVGSVGLVVLAGLLSFTAQAADPVRGAALFARQPQPNLLACIDCHSENPAANNFGNIWSGRNAVSLIQRAVRSNTGGMGYLAAFFSDSDFADIAAFLGNTPGELAFAATPLGGSSAAQRVTVSSSLKLPLEGLTFTVEGDFAQAGNSCGPNVPRFSSCAVDVVFRPSAEGARVGTLVIDHAGTPTPVRLRLSGSGQTQRPAVARVVPERVVLPAATSLQGAGRRNVVLFNDSEQPLRIASVTVAAEPAGLRVAGGSCAAGLLLGRGEQCMLALRHDGTDRVQGQLRIEHDGVGGQSLVALEGLAGRPAAGLEADAPQLNLGTHAVGEHSAPQTVTLAHRGAAPLVGLTLTTTDPAFRVQAGNCGGSGLEQPGLLQPGQRCQLSVLFTGPRAGRFTSELRVQGASGEAWLRLPLQAQADAAAPAAGPPPLPEADTALWLDQQVLDLGELPVASSSSKQALTVHNRSGTPLSWRHLGLTGDHAGDFLLGGDCRPEAPVPAGASCRVDVQLQARAQGDRSASLMLWPQGSATPAVVTLRGRGVLRLTSALVANATQMDFGPQPAEAAGLVRRLHLHNLGSADAAAPELRVEGPFVVASVDPACRVALPPGGRCTVALSFTASQNGAVTGTLQVTSAGSLPLRIGLSGTRVATGPALTWDDARADTPAPSHGLTPVGRQTPPQPGSWRLVNRGTAASPPLRWTISGPDSGDFIIDPTGSCMAGTALAAGASCLISVQFRPTAAGPRRALLVLAGQPGVNGLPLQGQGLAAAAPQLQFSPSTLVFQSRVGQVSASLPLWLHNSGTAALLLADPVLAQAAFALRLDEAGPCAGAVPGLLPGERCFFDASWSGAGAGLQGGSFSARSALGEAVATSSLTVSEDPAERTNLGAGSMGWGSLALLAMALALGLGLAPTGQRRKPKGP